MNLKPFVYKTGKNLTEIKELCNLAIKEAKILGVENDEKFIESTLVTLLDMDDQEYVECIRSLNKKFVESKYASFDDFMESLLDEEGVSGGTGEGSTMVSTAFDIDSRPENLKTAIEIGNQSKKKDDKDTDKLTKSSEK